MAVDPDGLLSSFPIKIIPIPISPPSVAIPGTPEHDEYMKWANKMGDNFHQNFSNMMSTLKDWSKRNCPMLNSSEIDKEQEKEKRRQYCADLYDSIVRDCKAERNAKKRRECYAAASSTEARCLQGEE